MAKTKKKDGKAQYKGFMVYFNVFKSLFERKPNETIGKAMKMVYMFARYGIEPAAEELTDGLDLVWDGYLEMVEYDRTSYYEACRDGAWGSVVKKMKAEGIEKTEEQQTAFFNEYDEKNRAEYMKTTLYRDYIENIQANAKMNAQINEAKKAGKDAAATERPQLRPEDLPPAPHAAKEPKEGSAVEP